MNMKIFEYPYVIITIFVMCFAVMSIIGISCAIRGVRTAAGKADDEFSSLSKLGKDYKKAGKLRVNRSVLYIGVSLENFRRLNSNSETQKVVEELRPILLHHFYDGETADVAVFEETNFTAFTTWDEDLVEEKLDLFLGELNMDLKKHKALNVADVHIGIYPAHGTDVSFDEAINRAKQAYMLAKNEGIPHAKWNFSGGKALETKIKIENNIENEIDNNRFFLEYQPFLDAKTKKIVGAEVLSRLNSETDGILTPGSFLSAVSSVGLNDKFDFYIFEKNCKWISNDKAMRERFKYSMNFSRATLCEPAFAKSILRILDRYGLNPSCIAVEVLEDEDLTVEEEKCMMKNLTTLKEAGIIILLDDFGSGYTTFEDLRNLDLSVVKIDKSIVHNSSTEAGGIIMKNLITTAKDLGYKVLCEGIENAEHEAAAINAGCDLLQGYYYFRPMPVARLEEVFGRNAAADEQGT